MSAVDSANSAVLTRLVTLFQYLAGYFFSYKTSNIERDTLIFSANEFTNSSQQSLTVTMSRHDELPWHSTWWTTNECRDGLKSPKRNEALNFTSFIATAWLAELQTFSTFNICAHVWFTSFSCFNFYVENFVFFHTLNSELNVKS